LCHKGKSLLEINAYSAINGFRRRYATVVIFAINRGLKPTAKFFMPLRGSGSFFIFWKRRAIGTLVWYPRTTEAGSGQRVMRQGTTGRAGSEKEDPARPYRFKSTKPVSHSDQF